MVFLQFISKTSLISHCRRAFTTLVAGRNYYVAHKISTILNAQRTQLQLRPLWGYVAIAFNKVDNDRLNKVGPDRLCAEWLLKNGGGVGLVGMPNRVVKDYNSLPPESVKFNVQVVDASNSSVMKMGLDHFAGCRHIDTVVLHNCKHLEDGGLEGLVHLKETLKKLQVSACYNLRDSCLDVITQLPVLEQVRLFDLIYVKDLQGVATKLRKALPNCKIELGAAE
ncbi:PREDICTED: ATP synthase subunit s, mitochondrial [Rhagoletis zephyria]|uniref:ATP synthase subunit s, mitochondrial n=1 Tax=Rhagoletis zephyria TaxID=28612 RepID=UPI000811746A|nr:PREDICTED: ATP synthase subunit s, mitochondrial [Rhagoletis zephyria]